MIIPSKHSGYRAGVRLYPGGGKGGGQQDPAIGEALRKQADTADRMADFVMKSYEDNQPMLKELQALNGKVIQQQMGMAEKASNRADDAYQYYTNVGRPAITKSITEAGEWDSDANIAKVRGRAAADVATAVDNAQGQQTRSLQRMGINPNSGKMLALSNQQAIAKAALTAGAVNNAEEGRRVQAVGLRQQAGNLASGFSAQSMQGMGQAGGFGSSAAGVGGNNLSQGMSTQNQAINGMGHVVSAYGSNASGYQNLGNAQDQRSQNDMAGIGQLVGIGASKFMADGGPVKGPGTGTSDSVPATNTDTGQRIALSNGEWVVPADVVRAKGQEFFQKLTDKHHKPVNLGRA